MKIKELNKHCEGCELRLYCADAFRTTKLCRVEELQDIDVDTYKQLAAAVTDKEIEDEIIIYKKIYAVYMGMYERVICNIVIKKLNSKQLEKEHEKSMKYLVFVTMKDKKYGDRQKEVYAIIRYDVPIFDSYEEAVQFAREECLKTTYKLSDFRILAEDYFKAMEHSRTKQTKGDNL